MCIRDRPQNGHKPCRDNKPFQDAGKGDGPPHAVQRERRGREDKRHGDARGVEYYGHNSGYHGPAETLKGTGASDLHAHEQLGIAQNAKIIHPHGQHGFLLNENAEQRLRENYEQRAGQKDVYKRQRLPLLM